MVKKLRVGLALQPVVTALFANSPFTEGKPNGFQSYRSEIWLDTDRDRTGMMPFAFEEGFGFEQYVDWALDVPMYFVKRGDTYHDVAGKSFRDLMAGRLDGLPGETATLSDWKNHLSTIFPEVRLKNYLEMRGADGGSFSKICAVPAFWVGLMYDSDSLEGAWQLVKDWTNEEREALRNGVPITALDTPFRNRIVKDIAGEVVALARSGLKNRGNLNGEGMDETIYLESIEQVLATGKTPADRLLADYEHEWQGNIDRVFDTRAY
jgi:glutamate--cysteine ligase